MNNLDTIAPAETKTAVYYNTAKKETYEIGGIHSMQQAHELYKFVCTRNNWNPSTFTHDVVIRLK